MHSLCVRLRWETDEFQSSVLVTLPSSVLLNTVSVSVRHTFGRTPTPSVRSQEYLSCLLYRTVSSFRETLADQVDGTLYTRLTSGRLYTSSQSHIYPIVQPLRCTISKENDIFRAVLGPGVTRPLDLRLFQTGGFLSHVIGSQSYFKLPLCLNCVIINCKVSVLHHSGVWTYIVVSMTFRLLHRKPRSTQQLIRLPFLSYHRKYVYYHYNSYLYYYHDYQ